jgi:hypothetical protein
VAKPRETPTPAPDAQARKSFYRLSDVADATDQCYRTVHRAAQAGKIRTVTFGGSRRIPADEYERILRRGW